MKLRKHPVFLALCCLAWLFFFDGTGAAVGNTITLITKPPLKQIRPDTRPVLFTLSATDRQGKPVKSGYLKVTLKSPARSKIFSTDYPWVEGTTLFILSAEIINGEFSFYYLPPIRGTYSLSVDFSEGGSRTTGKNNFQLEIHENPDEMKRLYLLLGTLFLIGMLAGIFTQRSKTALAYAALLCLTLNGTSHAHQKSHGKLKHEAQKNYRLSTPIYNLSVTLAPNHGIVGRTTQLTIKLTDKGKNDLKVPAFVELQIINAEDRVDIFRAVLFTRTGNLSPAIQFSDGAEHWVHIRVFKDNPAKKEMKPVTSFSKKIQVETFQPPRKIVARTLGFFLMVMTMGMFTGVHFEKILHRKEKP